MGFKGSVESFSLADVFQNLAMNQQTGTLRVFTPENEEKYVLFQSGQVRSLSRGQGKPLYTPAVLMARGYVTDAQIEEADGLQKQTLQSVMVCLTELGYITPEQLNEVAKLQIEEEIFDLFGWDKASFEFNDGNPPENMFSQHTSASLPISHLIMEAARRVDEWDRLRKQVPTFKEIYCMDEGARKSIEKGEMEVDPIELRVSTLIDSARDVEDIIEDSHLFKFEVLTALGSFLQSSLIRPAMLEELTLSEQMCAKNGLSKRRIKVLERILHLGGENPKMRRELADTLAKEDRIEKACIHYTVLGEAELSAGKVDVALDIFKRILSLSPKNVKAHEQLAGIYAKRGQKREAFIHYKELYEMFRDQNHMREARTSAAAALECDPTHIDLRTSLIELLVQDNQKDSAAAQLELLGDQQSRSGSTKAAVDAYRRAMQLRPNSKQLKKKLADVMLTKEDRVARKRRVLVAFVFMVVCGTVVGGIAFKEHMNNNAYETAQNIATPLLAGAEADEKNDRFREAKAKYLSAAEAYVSVERLFSPIMNINGKAKEERHRLKNLAESAEKSAQTSLENLARKADVELENAENALKAKRIYEARDIYKRILENPAAAEKTSTSAKENLAKVQSMIDKLEQGWERLKRDPNKEFEKVEDEAAFKRGFIEEFKVIPEFKVSEVELPLWIRPDVDDVKVYLDGRFLGSVNATGQKNSNTFRYPAADAHKFEFKKKGYKPLVLKTSELRHPVYQFKLVREPNSTVLVRHHLTADTTFSGVPLLHENSIYVGTSEGSLLEIRDDEQQPLLRRYDLGANAPLNREVYGPIHIIKRAGKPDLIVYTLRAGTCIALEAAGNKFNKVWESGKAGGKNMTAASAILHLSVLPNASIIALPIDKQLVLLDCDSGTEVGGSPVNFKFAITSSATVVEFEKDTTLVAGCKDGKLYGASLKNQTFREWNASGNAAAVRGVPILMDNKILVGADDGVIYVFSPNRANFPLYTIPLDDAGSIVSEPLIVKKRLYVGTIDREGLWCGDLGTQKTAWRVTAPEMGGVTSKPVLLENQIYFSTDRGRLYAVDAEKGATRWSYQTESGKPILGSPLLNGKRVYVVAKDGVILGFDEENE